MLRGKHLTYIDFCRGGGELNGSFFLRIKPLCTQTLIHSSLSQYASEIHNSNHTKQQKKKEKGKFLKEKNVPSPDSIA